MIKKKLNILLLLLLVVLFISLLGTTSFAKDLTDNDIKNFIYNYCIFYGYTNEQAEDYVTAFSNLPNANDNTQLEIDRWKNIANNLYSGQYILYGINNRICLWRYGGTDYNMTRYGPYFYFSYDTYYIYTNSSYLNSWNTVYLLSSPNSLTTTSSPSSITLGKNENQFFFYTDTNVYTNSIIANGSIKYNAGYMMPSNLFNGFYTDDYFDFVLNNQLTQITINGDSVPYYNFNNNSADSFLLGYLALATNYDYSEIFEYRWQNGWKLNKIYTLNSLGSIDSNDIMTVRFYGSALKNDTLYSLTMYSDSDSDFDNITQPFYIGSRNTKIVNGELDLNNTFSGDYYNNYNNDTNTQNIINNINDDSEVNNTLNNFISGDAEDIANKFGFTHYGSEYYDFIYRTIMSIVDVLSEDDDVYFDYSMHGEEPIRIYASSFTTPNGVLKTFLQMFLISCTIFVFYKNIADLFELLSTGNFYEVLDQLKVDRNIFKM